MEDIKAKQKKCRKCKKNKSQDEFVDIDGNKNPRGYYCVSCFNQRIQETIEYHKEKKASVLRKYKIIFGEFWRHYALPHDFRDDLYGERNFCPYCGKQLPPSYISADEQVPIEYHAHIDHMDPLKEGGEDSIRNTVYVCGECNLRKGDMSFIKWLECLTPKHKKISYEIYKQKHGHIPEKFKPVGSIVRHGGNYWEIILYSEEELREMYPTPKVDGPPTNKEIIIKLDIGDALKCLKKIEAPILKRKYDQLMSC